MIFCGIPVAHPYFLAPMAGITDSAFRTICAGQGASLTYTEMVSARALVYQDSKTLNLLSIEDDHRPCVLQLFGSEPEVMALAAQKALALAAPQIIDLNMGCPVNKIVGNGEGSALMRDPALAARIIGAVARAVDVPVTVKFRSGFFEGERTAVAFGRMAEEAGAAALCVHGRTRAQMYGGPSDREIIAQVKAAVSIPVAASGDAFSAAACAGILSETGADAVMIARGALGNPLIFADCAAQSRGLGAPAHTAGELLDILVRHAELTCARKGEGRAVPELRKHALWYLGRLRGAKPFKAEMARAASLQDIRRVARQALLAGVGLKTEAGPGPTDWEACYGQRKGAGPPDSGGGWARL